MHEHMGGNPAEGEGSRVMVRAYLLIEATAERAGRVEASVGHGLMNCQAIGYSLRPAEVLVHVECTDLADLHQAMTQDLLQLDGVMRITPLLVVKESD